ncbi:precorrin-6A synthase (deacetylating) [Nocardioides daejeonensis]|uniref:precorrin-6A synthase (deacetylating) n=1 Tax=Nocardioides daejeonensis TaxID=1046556 RepID=UPI000D74DE64|nr:precorrin-6A synthase (deacetylating) [Nocardioides daejeonensis]
MTRRVRLIGIGSGSLDQLTGEARAALASVDYVVAAAKHRHPGGSLPPGDSDPPHKDPLLAVRQALCDAAGVALVEVPDPPRDRDPRDYGAAVRDWHEARAAAYERVLLERPGDVGFLVWGDPSLYDSTIRVVEQVLERGRLDFDYDVLPGLAAPQLLAARHRIVLHEVGQPVLITTGRRLAEAVAEGHPNIVVMLDGSLAARDLPAPDRWRIWWSANLGTPAEELVSGPLGGVLAQIDRARERARNASGWVMETYLLRCLEDAEA